MIRFFSFFLQLIGAYYIPDAVKITIAFSPDDSLYLRDPQPRFHGEQVKTLQRFLAARGSLPDNDEEGGNTVKIWDILTGDSYILNAEDIFSNYIALEKVPGYSVPRITAIFWNEDEMSVNGELRLIVEAEVEHEKIGKVFTVALIHPWRQATEK